VLPFEGIGAIFGPSGSGKSFLTLDMLASVSNGGEWFGCRVKPASVLYVALEGEAGIAQRVKAYEMKHGPVSAGFRFMLQALDIRNAGDRADLVQAIKAAGWNGGVLCLDTLNRAAPGMDENDSKSMGEVIGAAKAIQAELGGLVLLVHHTGKDATKGMRGHSSLHAALDAAVEVCRDGDRREWKMHKSKDGEDGEAHPFRLEVVEVGSDDEGEPITSCAVMQEERAGQSVRRAKVPQGGNQRIVYDVLGELFRTAGCFAPEGAPKELPAGRPCLRLDEAIAKTQGRLPVEPDRQAERTRLAITGLISKGLIAHQGGFIWCK
jgi:RecA/RadA recombinase